MRQIVSNAACDHPVGIFARTFLGIRTGIRVRRSIGISFQGDGGHTDDQPLGQLLFQGVVLRLAFGQTKAPAIVMDHNADMIRIVEGHRGPRERGLIESRRPAHHRRHGSSPSALALTRCRVRKEQTGFRSDFLLAVTKAPVDARGEARGG